MPPPPPPPSPLPSPRFPELLLFPRSLPPFSPTSPHSPLSSAGFAHPPETDQLTPRLASVLRNQYLGPFPRPTTQAGQLHVANTAIKKSTPRTLSACQLLEIACPENASSRQVERSRDAGSLAGWLLSYPGGTLSSAALFVGSGGVNGEVVLLVGSG